MYFRQAGEQLILNLDYVIEGERLETSAGRVLRLTLESGHSRDLTGEVGERLWACLQYLATKESPAGRSAGDGPDPTGGEGRDSTPCDPPTVTEAVGEIG